MLSENANPSERILIQMKGFYVYSLLIGHDSLSNSKILNQLINYFGNQTLSHTITNELQLKVSEIT